jgi:hypothetical protein
MSSVSTNASRQEQRPSQVLSGYSIDQLENIHQDHRHEKIPLSYVNVPTNHYNGSSSSTSEITSITRLAMAAATRYGSPPKNIDDISYSMVPSNCMAEEPFDPISVSTFRLEPKFGTNTRLKSNPPVWTGSGTTTASIRGRKRTAQSMTLNNSHSQALARNGRSSNSVSQHTAPTSPRHIDSAMFNLQGLSLRSPSTTATAGTTYLNATDFRTATTQNNFVSSPAATHSTFTPCESSSFSKVNTSFTSPPATIDGTSSFHNYRSNSFGSILDYQQQNQPTIPTMHDGMPPPLNVEMASSSPRIVPLTVLTHDSKSQAMTPVAQHRRDASIGSSAPTTSCRPPLQHVFAMRMSPLLLTVDSSSTSEGCPSNEGLAVRPPTSPDKKNHCIFRDDYHRRLRTPQRTDRPPLSLVQYCPDSTHSTLSVIHDSPITSIEAKRLNITTMYEKSSSSFSSVGRLHLPKVSLTPRKDTSPNEMAAGLPNFPSPNGEDDEDDDRSGIPTVLPRCPSSISGSLCTQKRTAAQRLDNNAVNNDSNNETSSLDLSNDRTCDTKEIRERCYDTKRHPIVGESVVNTHSYIPFPKPSNVAKENSIELPQGSLSSKKVKKTDDILNTTVSSTPSAISVQDIIVDMNKIDGTNRLQHRNAMVDTESLSDCDDDEFFLAIPSVLVEEKQNILTGVDIRQKTKQPRLQQPQYQEETIGSTTPDLIGHYHKRNHASMTSFGSNSSLLGTGFALSGANLYGMDSTSASNPNVSGMVSNAMGSQHRSSLNFSYATNSVNGTGGMERIHSMTSIGLDLDLVVPSGNDDAPLVGRELITPPVMSQPSYPPPISPRFGSKKNNVWNDTIDNDHHTTMSTKQSTSPKDNLFY